jgi:hypothetical protein
MAEVTVRQQDVPVDASLFLLMGPIGSNDVPHAPGNVIGGPQQRRPETAFDRLHRRVPCPEVHRKVDRSDDLAGAVTDRGG